MLVKERERKIIKNLRKYKVNNRKYLEIRFKLITHSCSGKRGFFGPFDPFDERICLEVLISVAGAVIILLIYPSTSLETLSLLSSWNIWIWLNSESGMQDFTITALTKASDPISIQRKCCPADSGTNLKAFPPTCVMKICNMKIPTTMMMKR